MKARAIDTQTLGMLPRFVVTLYTHEKIYLIFFCMSPILKCPLLSLATCQIEVNIHANKQYNNVWFNCMYIDLYLAHDVYGKCSTHTLNSGYHSITQAAQPCLTRQHISLTQQIDISLSVPNTTMNTSSSLYIGTVLLDYDRHQSANMCYGKPHSVHDA